MITADLTAYATTPVTGITSAQARALAASGVLTVAPRGADSWDLTASSWVGVMHVEDVEVRIRPRVAIARLLFLLGYAQDPDIWRDDPADLDDQVDLWPAMAHVFVRQATKALQRGLMQGYRVEEQAQVVLRGRLREADQLRRHAGLPVPLEVRFDEYDTDIPENQVLLAATMRLLKLPRLHPTATRSLRQLRLRFADVSALVAGQPLPPTPPSRRTVGYQPALALAWMVLRGRSVDIRDAGVRATGFLVDMNKAFEDFVTTALAEAWPRDGGRCVMQSRHVLDTAHRVHLKPDLVRFGRGGAPQAVVDAKYKAQSVAGYPNADLYQLLAYCTALQLSQGHLVYAEGDTPSTRVQVAHADISIYQHAVDLTKPPRALLGQIAELAARIAAPHRAP